MSPNSSRGRFLASTAAFGLGAVAKSAFPAFGAVPAKLSGKVYVMSLGGAYAEAEKKAIYDPFSATTGIEVIPVPMNSAQMVAALRSGNAELDVIDTGQRQALQVDRLGLLAPIDYGKFKFSNPKDVDAAVRRPRMVGNIYFATVIGYTTKGFERNHPSSWGQVWDTKGFPGPRTFEALQAGQVGLELALLASGVPMNKLYPLDVKRAFSSFGRIRNDVVKWWTTGAESAELLESGQAAVAEIWNGRVQTLIDAKAPFAIEWNQAMRHSQFWAIPKSAPNVTNAQALVDFALQPKMQAELARYISYAPTVRKAFAYIPKDDAAKLASNPAHARLGFDEDAEWWVDHMDEVRDAWQRWYVGG